MFKEPPYNPKHKPSDESTNVIKELQMELAKLKQQLSDTKSG